MFLHRKHKHVPLCVSVSLWFLHITVMTSFSFEKAYSSQFLKSTKRIDRSVSKTRGRLSEPSAYRNNQGLARAHRSSASRSTCSQKCPAAAPKPCGALPLRPTWFPPPAHRKPQS